MLKRHLYVAPSALHGRGLFTHIALPPNTLLGVCQSRRAKRPSLYTLTMATGEIVHITCKLKYINHSKRPNVAYYDDLTVMTLRAIDAGEELTHDYGDEWPV